MTALGGSYAVTFPMPIGRQTVEIPIEQMSRDAVSAAWPTLQTRLRSELPRLTAQAMQSAQKPALGALALILGTVVVAAWWVKRG